MEYFQQEKAETNSEYHSKEILSLNEGTLKNQKTRKHGKKNKNSNAIIQEKAGGLHVPKTSNRKMKEMDWIAGDISKFNFNEELVSEDESNKRLIQMFLGVGVLLMVIVNILMHQCAVLG